MNYLGIYSVIHLNEENSFDAMLSSDQKHVRNWLYAKATPARMLFKVDPSTGDVFGRLDGVWKFDEAQKRLYEFGLEVIETWDVP